jgi:hypothetical protein
MSMVLASQRLPIPRAAFQILKLQQKWPVAFCIAMFVAWYSLATFCYDFRKLAFLIPHHMFRAQGGPREGARREDFKSEYPERTT